MLKLTQVLFVCFLALTIVISQKNGDEGRPYEFGFTIDGEQHRFEKKDEKGIVQGEFGFITGDGVYHVTVYATDENGKFKILSMRNIRISGPLDGSPFKGEISPEAEKYRKKAGLPPLPPAAATVPQVDPNPLAIPESAPAQTIISTTPNSGAPYKFTTQPTIKPACASCGLISTKKPGFEFQNPLFNKQDKVNQPSFNKERPIQSGVGGPNIHTPGIDTPQPYGDTYTNNGGLLNHQNPSFGGPSNTPYPTTVNVGQNPLLNTPSNTQYPPFGKLPNTQYPNTGNADPILPFGNPPNVHNPTTGNVVPPPSSGPLLNPHYPNPGNVDHNASQVTTSIDGSHHTQPSDDPRYPEVPQNVPESPNGQRPEYQQITGPQITHYRPNGEVQDHNQPGEPQPNPLNLQSTLPPISVTDGLIQIGGDKKQEIPIRDKFPGMQDGLPEGIDEKDITNLLYKFHYTVGFHGHYEKGLKNGAKVGGYFVNGRDGISRVVTYVADENGYRPKVKFINLGLDSEDTPKPETEKSFGLKSFEFVWYPVE